MSAIRFLQISYGLPDPSLSSVPRLEYVLKGVRRGLPAHSRPKRLPITPYILRIIHRGWSQDPMDHDKVMLWAACCLAFFGFLRCGEFTCPCLGAYSPTMLSPTDIRVDSHVNPQCLAVHLRQSKTDPFGAGVTLYLGRTGDVLCPVTSVLAYLAIRQATPGPLFIFRDGIPLSRTHFVAAVRQVLQAAGVDTSSYTGLSFRIGAATTAAGVGLSDSLIKTVGRWKSAAYATYIRTPRERLMSILSVLAGWQR